MPIYEYKAVSGVHCRLCRGRFEVRQRMDDEPLKICPECGAAIGKLFSPPFLLRRDSFGGEETFDGYAGGEADEFGLEEELAENEAWD